jgi:hypothetical protein
MQGSTQAGERQCIRDRKKEKLWRATKERRKVIKKKVAMNMRQEVFQK